MGTPRSLLDFITAPKPVYGPPSPTAPPPSDLPASLTALIDLVRGATVGAGDDPSATPNRWLRGGELLAAVPFGSLRSLTGLVKGAPSAAGFFSRVDDAVARLIPAKGAHPNKVASLLKSHASAEELAYRKVPEFLAAQGNATVTPAQLQAHLAKHPAPVPTVKTLQSSSPYSYQGLEWQHAIDAAERRGDFAEADRISRAWEGLNEATGSTAGQPKYAQYQLPGGEQYRETLLTLPGKMPEGHPPDWRVVPPREQGPVLEAGRQQTSPYYRVFDANGDLLAYGNTHDQAITQALADTGIAPELRQFESGHFDEPNILVHTRANERVLPTGERGRFVEEVQSDWHQQGKARGYKSDAEARFNAIKAELEQKYGHNIIDIRGGKVPWSHALDEDLRRMDDAFRIVQDETHGRMVVPDAPFKESWPDLGLKQQLLETAADPNASWLGFTSGQTQAARYDLSQQISKMRYDPNTHYLEAYDRRGERVIQREGVRPEQLPDYIGKEPADKLRAQPLKPDRHDNADYHTLEGVDLQVGGAGMRHFYDQVLPKRLEKILKPFGGTVERGVISGDPSAPADVVARYANQPEHPFTQKQNVPMWFARLTPEMKARILKEGLPLLTLPLAAWVASQESPPSDAELFSLSRFAQRPSQRRAQ